MIHSLDRMPIRLRYPAALKQAAFIAKETFSYQICNHTRLAIRKKSLHFTVKIGYILCSLLLIKILFQYL